MEITRLVVYYLIGVNLLTFIAYGIDKYKARHKQWRMPSSSRAYPMPLAEKSKYYHEMMKTIGII